MARTFVKGDKDCESATSDLQDAVTSFNEELISLCASLGIRTVTTLDEIAKRMDLVHEGIRNSFVIYLRDEPSILDAA